MSKIKTFFLINLTLLFFLQSCSSPNENQTSVVHLIPQPAHLELGKGHFEINKQTQIEIINGDEQTLQIANYFKNKFQKASGISLPISESPATPQNRNSIVLEISDQVDSAEKYELNISKEKVQIIAKEAAGLFYGIQSLRQLLPVEIESPSKIENISWVIPAVKIDDVPRFPYRGIHLDVGRHFFPPDFIKKFIDVLAYHKYNTFHWHLTEDQGWRIEIKKYPKLTEIGGWRKETLVGHGGKHPYEFDGKRYGGFYTQEEIKEIVAYAQERFITVIPEIELPGHSMAALAAYPELGCSDKTYEVATTWGVFDDVYCPTEETFQFLKNVLTEVMALFPSTYIHIGGDECPKKSWEESAFCQNLIKEKGLKDEHELQSYFIKRMEKFLNANGRSIIGWEEIMEGGLAQNATVMSWLGMESGTKAVQLGNQVIMTPVDFAYFDYYQSHDPKHPLSIGGYLPLEKVYSFNPIPKELTESEAKNIIGAQGNIWTEYIKTSSQLEFMAFPRACAMAEVVWSPQEGKDYLDFTKRLGTHLKRLKYMDINFANYLNQVKLEILNSKAEGLKAKLFTGIEGTKIFYTTDGSTPTANSAAYQNAIPVNKSFVLKAQSFTNGAPTGIMLEQPFEVSKVFGKSVQLAQPPHEKFASGGAVALVNGVKASPTNFKDSEWLGFSGKNFEAIIDLGQSENLETIDFQFFKGEGDWIYLPKNIRLAISENGIDFSELKIESEALSPDTYLAFPENTKGRYLKIDIERHGIIAEKNAGAGEEAWLFVGEILVR